MSNLAASRKGPLLIAGGVLAGLVYFTYGGRSQPRPVARNQGSVSETLQAAAGTGGPRARDDQAASQASDVEKKDTRVYSASPSAYSKRDVDKVRGEGQLNDGR
ncbi:hypothetical protein VTJ49DRAFT_3109 [Mycothermus thermophilus]|uniref:Uncharacterized protein n=1 Tax=Humicola insolens TaxID=85995 RepID=A0ABR3V9F2_HUMIN